MFENSKIIALRMERQHLTCKANEEEYMNLYRDTQPGQNVYWNGFGDPPTITYRADFNDMEFNRERQRNRRLIKGRFAGGNLGWIVQEDLELFACAYENPLAKPSERQLQLLELIEKEGSLTIQQMKEATGMLVKEITHALHRLQEAFLIYEDQYDGEWDRGWYRFSEMFPEVDLSKYPRSDVLKILLKRFAYRHVSFNVDMARSFYRLPVKEIKSAIDSLIIEDVLTVCSDTYILKTDIGLLQTYCRDLPEFTYAMHRNDFLVKSNEHILKDKYPHSYPDTLYYLLIDGEFHGAVTGKFRYSPEVSDVILDLPPDEAILRKDEIIDAIKQISGKEPQKYQGVELS